MIMVYILDFLQGGTKLHWRPLLKLRDYAELNSSPVVRILEPGDIESFVPVVFPENDHVYLSSAPSMENSPSIYVVTVRGGYVCGGSNLVMIDNQAICHDLYDFESDFTSEELHGRHKIDPIRRRIRWLLQDKFPEEIAVAASFVDACAANYAHWLTEVLPRIAAFCGEEQFQRIPLVVNEGLHKNILESLFSIVGTEREIITLPIGRAIRVNELYITSAAGYVPFGRRSKCLSAHAHGVFNPIAFELIRNRIQAQRPRSTKQIDWPKRIYLRRNSEVRTITNAGELERLLLSHGFTIIEPEKLTFMDQFQLFSGANEVVSLTGAALSNAIFCKPGTKVVVLMGKHKDMIFRYWINMLAPLGIDLVYVLGEIVKNSSAGIHGDFYIEVDNVTHALMHGFQK